MNFPTLSLYMIIAGRKTPNSYFVYTHVYYSRKCFLPTTAYHLQHQPRTLHLHTPHVYQNAPQKYRSPHILSRVRALRDNPSKFTASSPASRLANEKPQHDEPAVRREYCRRASLSRGGQRETRRHSSARERAHTFVGRARARSVRIAKVCAPRDDDDDDRDEGLLGVHGGTHQRSLARRWSPCQI